MPIFYNFFPLFFFDKYFIEKAQRRQNQAVFSRKVAVHKPGPQSIGPNGDIEIHGLKQRIGKQKGFLMIAMSYFLVMSKTALT